ncbi:Nudix hydrolase [Mycobacterium tuberculosis]|uniref:Nudix hydrolase n=1 Tax=Mycobacterium tuberculosis TaxID=1773 RepID=A0A654U666_MYCTX|nr:Nudix hydrolase [Mycobacterium tuberculosis]
MLVDLDTAPGFSDESVRVYLATGLREVGRPEAHHEEADMTMGWYPIAEAARRVLRGEIVNSIAIAGVLAVHAVTTGFAQPRPLDTEWIDRPTAFAARRAER